MFLSTFYFHIVIILIYYAEGNDLFNMAVVLGRQISMTCGESANDSSVQWKFQLLGDFEERFIFNGYKIFQEFSEFRAVVDGRFRLSTAEAQVKHTGTYFCIRISGQHTETYSAKLTVLESEPICGTNASNADDSIVENDYLELWCKIRYSGALIPRMEWHRSDEANLTANSTYGLQELYYVIVQHMKAEDNAINYTVTTIFETPAAAEPYENVITALIEPEYKWIFSPNVLYGPRDISITPQKMTYRAGDVLHCSAVGNPTPVFEWTEIGSAYYVDGPQLKVNETMALKPESTYRCTAVNKVAGQRNIASDTVVIGVPGTSLDKYSKGFDTYVYVGVGAAVIGIILTVITAAMCRLSKCKCNANNPKADDERSSSHVYEYVSPEDPFQRTSSQEVSNRTNTPEEITDQAIASYKEDIDTPTNSEQEYNTTSGRPVTQPVQVYTAIKVAYENVSNPKA